MGNKIATGLIPLDFFLCGGFEVPGFIHLYGEPGTGKSTLGYHLVQSFHKNGERVVWIDFNSSFSMKRLLSIVKDKSVIHSLTLISITSKEYFISMLSGLISIASQTRLIILDNFTYFYQLSDNDKKKGEFYQMFQQLVRLISLIRRNRMLGLLINQVRSTKDGNFYPVGGQLVNEISRYVFAIKKMEEYNELEVIKGKTNHDKLLFKLMDNGWNVIPNGIEE